MWKVRFVKISIFKEKKPVALLQQYFVLGHVGVNTFLKSLPICSHGGGIWSQDFPQGLGVWHYLIGAFVKSSYLRRVRGVGVSIDLGIVFFDFLFSSEVQFRKGQTIFTYL